MGKYLELEGSLQIDLETIFKEIIRNFEHLEIKEVQEDERDNH